jgi:hypothetical protein
MNHTIVIENYSTVHLRGHFNIPDISMSPLFMDELSEGIFGDAMAKYDNILTEEIRNHLNESLGVSHSGNINRMRAIISRGFNKNFNPFLKNISLFCCQAQRFKNCQIYLPFAMQNLSSLFTFTMLKLSILYTFMMLELSGLFTFTMKKLSSLFTFLSFFYFF